ncbi:pilus assembly protein TadG-related protein [Microbacterium oleivorans]|uniref:pilus assembly protein TadG-related protein n=1 Tax=Microbacterium oleivorans TaxID=273677 RepID=UPI002040BD5B|nr:pilus assembly protein TadG-related protein [Microbacterium oleivorans]MCM3696309.1 pilus assembly protein TadG-related protein [Microbacterium oleivorans]
MTARDDDGSVLLLTIGYALLALVLVFVCVDATSLYLAQKRTQAAADAAALAGADGFTLEVRDGEPWAQLSDAGVREQAEALIGVDGGVRLVSAVTPDGVSARVTVSATWHPPISSVFVPAGVALDATATSRTSLD